MHVSEADVRAMFEPFGQIQECVLLRNSDGDSVGCALVTYARPDCAAAAVDTLHRTQRMLDRTYPLVVTYADGDKRRRQQWRGNANHGDHWQPRQWSGPPETGFYGEVQPNSATFQPGLAMRWSDLPAFAYPVNTAPYTDRPVHVPGTGAVFESPFAVFNNSVDQPRAAHPNLGSTAFVDFGPAYTAAARPPLSRPQSPLAPVYLLNNVHVPARPPLEGPEDCNLFVYNLPVQYTDADLMAMFSPFGPVLSAKVFVKNSTGQSMGFGFVSFDDKQIAHAAILAMNNTWLGHKRLSVQLKKPRAPPTANQPGMSAFRQ